MISWFPSGRNDEAGWRLDVVSLLAVIGESTMAKHVQPLTSTWLCLLPRLIPAPQALLKSKRPTRLPTKHAVVVGVFSGTRVDELNFYADLIHDIGELKPLEFREYTITCSRNQGDIENGRQVKRVFHRFFSPLNILTIFSCIVTMLLIIWACMIHDGVATISLALMSLASVLVGLALWWDPALSIRPTGTTVPDGDVVIRTREGAFVVVHCSEEIARELYTGSEEAKYRLDDKSFKALVGLGTVTLMVAVVLLGNSSWTMQAAIGATYLVLNGAYWAAALLPQTLTWDKSYYNVERKNAHLKAHEQGADRVKPNFTRTLWYAIQATQETGWIYTIGAAAPDTSYWKEWTQLADQDLENPRWGAIDAIDAKDRLMRLAKQKQSQRAKNKLEKNDQIATTTTMVS